MCWQLYSQETRLRHFGHVHRMENSRKVKQASQLKEKPTLNIRDLEGFGLERY